LRERSRLRNQRKQEGGQKERGKAHDANDAWVGEPIR
jgi:hypothetical protein